MMAEMMTIEVKTVRHIVSHAFVVLRSEALAHFDAKTDRDAHGEAQNQKVDGTGGSHSCQGVDSHEFSHDNRIHHTVKLLEHAAQKHGDKKFQYQSQRTLPRVISLLICFSSFSTYLRIAPLQSSSRNSANIRNPLIYCVNRYFLMFGGSQVQKPYRASTNGFLNF